MSDKKKYVVTSITLGVIAASSAGLIGLANLITRDRIAQNEKDRINAGITRIFGQNAEISSENDAKSTIFQANTYSNLE